MRCCTTRAISRVLTRVSLSIEGLVILIFFSSCLTFLIFLFFESRNVKVQSVIWVICNIEFCSTCWTHGGPCCKSTYGVIIQANGIVVHRGFSWFCITLLQVVIWHHLEIFTNFTSTKIPCQINIVYIAIYFCPFMIVWAIAEYVIALLFLHLIIVKS